MLDQAPCGPAVPCLSRQARAAVMVRLRGEADAGHRSAVSGHRSPVKQVIGRQCHSGVSVIRVNTGMVNFRKFLLPNKAVIFLKIFREIYICPNARPGTRSYHLFIRARRLPPLLLRLCRKALSQPGPLSIQFKTALQRADTHGARCRRWHRRGCGGRWGRVPA